MEYKKITITDEMSDLRRNAAIALNALIAVPSKERWMSELKTLAFRFYTDPCLENHVLCNKRGHNLMRKYDWKKFRSNRHLLWNTYWTVICKIMLLKED